MFMRGCNPRALDDPSKQITEEIVPSGHPYGRLWMQLVVLWFGAFENRKLLVTIGKHKQTRKDRFWKGKWTRFVCSDCKLRKSVPCDHGTRAYEWEGQLKPVSLVTMYKSHGPELAYALDALQYEGSLIVIDGKIFPVSLGQYLGNLSSWGTSLSQILSRRWYSFYRTPQEMLEFVDDLSAFGKQILKEAVSASVTRIN